MLLYPVNHNAKTSKEAGLMNKKTNTIIFMLAATVANIIITIVCFLVLLVLYSKIVFPLLPEESITWALPVMFVFSIIASIFIYRLLIKFMMKKVDMEKYFDPIFSRRHPQKP